MRYFKHTYNGIEYEFKPNRKAQCRVDEMRRSMRAEIPEEVKNNAVKILYGKREACPFGVMLR